MNDYTEQAYDSCAQALETLGWPYQRPRPSHVTFDHRGFIFNIHLHGDDPELLHLILVCGLPAHLETADIGQACTEATRGIKVAKASHQGHTVTITAEQIIAAADRAPDPALLIRILPRLVDILRDALELVHLDSSFRGIAALAEGDHPAQP